MERHTDFAFLVPEHTCMHQRVASGFNISSPVTIMVCVYGWQLVFFMKSLLTASHPR